MGQPILVVDDSRTVRVQLSRMLAEAGHRATVFVLANLVADVLYAWLDPRIRYDKK